MPIILGPDGPSLGGFVCPVTIVEAELWKIGQLKAGDTVRFVPWSEADGAPSKARANPVIREVPASEGSAEITYRRSGDRSLLVEYGPMVLDLALRFRVHLLMQWLVERRVPGIVDLTPGIRSLQIHYDGEALTLPRLMGLLTEAESKTRDLGAMAVPTRIVRMPLSWDDAATQLAIEKYVQSVRPDAPWAPSNIEFIRRINGLESVDDVRASSSMRAISCSASATCTSARRSRRRSIRGTGS